MEVSSNIRTKWLQRISRRNCATNDGGRAAAILPPFPHEASIASHCHCSCCSIHCMDSVA